MKQLFKINNYTPGIAWFFVVLILICLPGRDIPKVSELEFIHFDKIVHISIFGLLTLLMMMPTVNSSISKKSKLLNMLLILIVVSIWGLTTEFIQKYLIPGRSFDLLDWAADSFGAFIAFIICRKKIAINFKKFI